MDNHCRSIGFPLISSGIFGYPHDEAWKIALSACKDFINENPGYDISIVFVSTNRDMVEQGKQILAKLNEVKILRFLPVVWRFFLNALFEFC